MAFQDFDLIEERNKITRKKKVQRIVTFSVVASIAIIGIVVAVVFVNINKIDEKGDKNTSNNQHHKQSSPKKQGSQKSSKLVNSICGATDYKATCESHLQKVANSNPSAQPKDFLKSAISVISNELDKAMDEASKIKFDSPKMKAAFDVCKKVMEDAKQEIASSASSVNKVDLEKLSSKTHDLDNWLSAVMSYQQICIDSIPEGEKRTKIEKALKTSKELTSNSLALVSHLSSASQKFSFRRLLPSDNLPFWMSNEERRILKADAPKQKPNITVAKDGSGDFTKINDALAALPTGYKGRYVIYIKEGTYEEHVEVSKKMVNITMFGDGSQKTIITGNKNFVDGVPTFKTATFAAIGDGFMAQSIGFRNTAGAEKHQAVALRVQSDRSIFINCRMEAYQDTLYAQTHRQFYRGCYITGTIDFIFGDAAAIFQTCNIYVRKPSDNQKNIVTAQGRADKRETTGIVLQGCHIMAAEEFKSDQSKFRTYLGRPWKEYSRTIVMETEIDDLIDPAGWLEWQGDFALKTLYYAEFNNKGSGAETKNRVKWPGVKVINKDEANKFTVSSFLQGESWLKGEDISVPVRFSHA
ncbi:hypothetical protein AgCh_006279 [Apium graveolens]